MSAVEEVEVTRGLDPKLTTLIVSVIVLTTVAWVGVLMYVVWSLG